MSLNLKNKFADKVTFAKYSGIAPVRIVEDEDGLVINPTVARLAKHFDGFNEDSDEREYYGEAEITRGWTNFKELEGKKIVSQEDFDNLGLAEKDSHSEPIKTQYANVTFLVQTIGNVEMKKLITFRMFKGLDVTNKGDKVKVYNKFGSTAYQTFDGETPEFFDSSDAAQVKECPISRSPLDFEAMINFIYAYSALSKKEALVENLDVEALFEGDVSSIEEIIEAIHEGIVTEDGVPLYGAMVPFIVENNRGTNDENVQSYLPYFERAVISSKGDYNKECSFIQKQIAKSRRVSSNGKVYSPESKGQFIGHEGLMKIGLKEFKPSYMDSIKAKMSQAAATPAAKPPTHEDVFGDGGSVDEEYGF